MAQSNWEADKMLDVYIYDHLVKKKLHNTANSFMTERKVSPDPVAIDAPGGFLFEWWSVFWEMYYARTKEKHDESAVEYGLNVYIYDYLVKKKLHYTANSFMTEVKVSPDHVVTDTPGGFLFEWWSVFWDVYIAKTNEKHSESAAEAQQGKTKEQMKQPVPMNTEPHMDAGTGHHGQMVQGNNQGGVSAALQSRTQQTPLINMPPVQHSSSQQQDPLLSQQSQQNNSTGTGNTVGSSNSQPSTHSTHTPVEGVAMTGNMPKGPMMYGSDAIGGLASSANQLLQDDMEPFGDVGALEDNVESFLSQDDGDGGSLFGTLKRNPSEHTETSKVFSFNEVGSIRRSASKVICCNFSSDGKLLASAGHDKKVFIWNMETLHTEIPPEEHGHIITDVRFQPNSTQLATSSFDKTIKIWDVSKPGYLVRTISGHNAPVMSLDFHPKKTDLFCSCDTNNEIRFWSINAANCLRGIKGASTQVRFQPKVGQMLAAASENIVSIFDVEQYRGVHSFKGHSSSVHSICWNPTGELVASVSEDSVKVWSVGSGECIHELSSSGNKFHSCVYHPTYPNLLVIGGYQSLELWDTGENKCMTIAAHECVISALAQSSSTGMMASASHDKSVKIWK